MSYMISHYFAGGTQEQYEAMVKVVHPEHGLPDGQTHHFAGPAEDGWLVVAVWDSQESSDRFVQDTLVPTLGKVEGGFSGPPQQRACEVVNQVTG